MKKAIIDVQKKYGIDTTTAEVLRNGFIAISKQMTRQLIRSSFSPVVRDYLDYTTALTSGVDLPDLNMDMVASGEGAALHYATGQFSVRTSVLEWGLNNLDSGDILAFNDPFRGGNHLNDIAFVKPVFHEKEILGFVFLRCHWPDVGGMAVGSYSPGAATEAVQEGLRFGPMLLFKKNRPVKSMFNLMLDNSRSPSLSYNDLFAAAATLDVGEAMLKRYIQRYGVRGVKAGMKYTLDHGELMTRRAIEAIPDGVYEYEDYMDDDGLEGKPIKIKVAVTIKGDSAEIDFSGTSRQALGNVNCPYSICATGAYTGFKMVVDPYTPSNAGCWRPIDLVIPEGTVVNALPPAATSIGFQPCFITIDLVAAALSQAVGKDRAVAQSFGSHFCTVNSGVDPRNASHYIMITILLGGFGGNYIGDGNPFCSGGISNALEISAEILEQDFPVITLYKEFAMDTAGAGKFRGGPATVWDLVTYTGHKLSSLSDRFRITPHGVWGGRNGTVGYYYVINPERWDPRERGFIETNNGLTPENQIMEYFEPLVGMFSMKTKKVDLERGIWLSGKFSDRPMKAWSTLRRISASSAGCGNPFERDAELVLRDVRDEYISIENAKTTYGVVIKGSSDSPETLKIDLAQTNRLRNTLTRKQ